MCFRMQKKVYIPKGCLWQDFFPAYLDNLMSVLQTDITEGKEDP